MHIMRILRGPVILMSPSMNAEVEQSGRTRMFCYRCRRHYMASTESMNELTPECNYCGSTFVEHTGNSLPASMLILDYRLQHMMRELAETTNRLIAMAQERASLEEDARTDPASKAVVDSLTEFTVTKSNARSCPSCVICMEEWGEGDDESSGRATRLSCSHMFHLGCIKQWLSSKSRCPCCRRKVKKSKPVKRKRIKAATDLQRPNDGAASASVLAGDVADEAEAKATGDEAKVTEDEAKVAETEASPMETT